MRWYDWVVTIALAANFAPLMTLYLVYVCYREQKL